MTPQNDSETSTKSLSKSITRGTDWEFFLKKLEDNQFEIPHGYDKESWKFDTVYRISVTHIYDLSHFWIVTKNEELDLFHEYLLYFYGKFKEEYRVPIQNLKRNMYCVCYRKSFYRGQLRNVARLDENKSVAFVHLIDFGSVVKVPLDEIYFPTEKMYTVPKFAIRACLSGMAPFKSNRWSMEVVQAFHSIVLNRYIFTELVHKNDANRILYLKLAEFNVERDQLESIDNQLVSEELARLQSKADIDEISIPKDRNRKLAYLYPSFHEIETNQVTDSFSGALLLQEYIDDEEFDEN